MRCHTSCRGVGLVAWTLSLAVLFSAAGCGGSMGSGAVPADAAPVPGRAVAGVDGLAVVAGSADGDSPAPEPELTAAEILALAEAKCDAIDDYHCVSKVFTRAGEETENKVLNVSFKRPGMFRNEVIEGDNEGGCVTRNAEGVIHGRHGGVLSIIVLTLKEDDERIRSLRGRRFFEASWADEVGDLRRAIDEGYQPRRLENQTFDGVDCYVIAAVGSSTKTAVTSYEMWIEKESHLLRRRRDFEGQTLAKDTRFMNPEINLGTPDEHFTLK